MLLGVSDLISLPLPCSEKTLTAFWAKVCLLFSVRARKPWSQPGDCRTRGSHFELVLLRVPEFLLVIIVAYWFVQITPLLLAASWDTHAWQGYYRTQKHTHPDLRKAKSHKPQERRSGWINASAKHVWTDFPPTHQKNWWVNEKARCPGVASYGGFFYSQQGFSQLSLKQRCYSDPPHTRGICQTDEPTPKIDCISYD